MPRIRRTHAGSSRPGRKRVVDLETEEGYRLTLTPDHRVRRVAEASRYAMTTEWIEAGSLRPGDEIVLHDHRKAREWGGPGTEAEGYLVGLLVGDGTLKEDAAVLSAWPGALAVNGGYERPGVAAVMDAAWAAARRLPHRADFRGWHAVPGRGEYRMKLGKLRRLAGDLGLRPGAEGRSPPPCTDAPRGSSGDSCAASSTRTAVCRGIGERA